VLKLYNALTSWCKMLSPQRSKVTHIRGLGTRHAAGKEKTQSNLIVVFPHSLLDFYHLQLGKLAA
ncbi:unnamed protein product, partial [Aphanomyces euteiches]